MRIALWQTEGAGGDPRANLQRLAPALDAARRAGAALLVCPELWTTGYNAPDAIRAFAEPPEGPTFAGVATLARRFGLAVAYGYAERAPDGTLYNSARLVGPDGAGLINHRKIFLWADYERGLFAPGHARFAVAVLEGWGIGLCVCYDCEFPETVRGLAMAGADLVLAPTALPDTPGAERIPDLLIPARALENGVFVAYCTRRGAEGEAAYLGASCVAGPDGGILARAGREERLLLFDLDRSALQRARERTPYLADLRRSTLRP